MFVTKPPLMLCLQQNILTPLFYFAAQTMVPYSLQHPQEDCNVNLLGLINILECCRKYNVKSVVFSSSAAVYGDNPNIPLSEDLPSFADILLRHYQNDIRTLYARLPRFVRH